MKIKQHIQGKYNADKLKGFSHVWLFFLRFFFPFSFSKHLVSFMATKSSLCRQTVRAPEPQTASWSELLTTNNYQTHHSDLEKPESKAVYSCTAKWRKNATRNGCFLFIPFFHIQQFQTQHSAPWEQPPPFRFLCISSVHSYRDSWTKLHFTRRREAGMNRDQDVMSDRLDFEHQQLFGIRL